MSGKRAATSLWRDVAAVLVARLGVSALVLALGFRAVSDDDFARVVIAQRFALQPSWDPSGTSWLPLPFWLSGAAMMLVGRSLSAARATAVLLGLIAAALLVVAARWLVQERRDSRGALAGALLACALPYFAWLGVATVPEALTAALLVLGCASLATSSDRARLFGGAALGAACLCRYEAWPVAAAFTSMCLLEFATTRRPSVIAAAALAAAPAAAWLWHGAAHHGTPLFFVARVAAYRDALHVPMRPLADRLLHYPLALAQGEPVLLTWLVGMVMLERRALHAHWRRPVIALAALLAFLVVSELRRATATHHEQRPLLALWLMAALATGILGERWWRRSAPRQRALLGSLFIACGALAFSFRHQVEKTFVERQAEVAIGERARELVPKEQRLAIDTPDFGYYAVMAAFTRPEQSVALDDHDPRRARAPSSFTSPEQLAGQLFTLRTGWLVAAGPHADVARTIAREEARAGAFVLLRALPQAGMSPALR